MAGKWAYGDCQLMAKWQFNRELTLNFPVAERDRASASYGRKLSFK